MGGLFSLGKVEEVPHGPAQELSRPGRNKRKIVNLDAPLPGVVVKTLKKAPGNIPRAVSGIDIDVAHGPEDPCVFNHTYTDKLPPVISCYSASLSFKTIFNFPFRKHFVTSF